MKLKQPKNIHYIIARCCANCKYLADSVAASAGESQHYYCTRTGDEDTATHREEFIEMFFFVCEKYKQVEATND